MKLEPMGAFFSARLNGYDEHMRTEIEGAKEFYPYTASLLPTKQGTDILDLGCGTGLELEDYFTMGGKAKIVGIDLSEDMLAALKNKFVGKEIELYCASYFDVPFGTRRFDAAVSVESLHHFKAAQKLGLYTKLASALKDTGYFVLTDFFAETENEETFYFSELERLQREQGLDPNIFYHYDTPLTVNHEIEILTQAGFSEVRIMKRWGNTYTLFSRR